MPTDAAVVGVQRLWQMGFPHNAKRKLRGIKLVASDASLQVGEGAEVSALVRDILMVLTGRSAPLAAEIAAARAG
ncbi:MAG: hypothetical protein ACSLE6_17170 [Mycobacterium sp.]